MSRDAWSECGSVPGKYTLSSSTDLLRSDSVPNIVVGVVGHHPYFFGGAANQLVAQVLGSGHAIDHVVGELAYFPHTRPDLVQQPLRKHGAKLVMEYTAQQEGRVLASSAGAVLVEGT